MFFTQHPVEEELKGVIRITPTDILIKIDKMEPVTFGIGTLLKIDYNVTEYEAEDRASDMLSKRNRYSVRSGENNFVAWQSGETIHRFQFKIGNEFEMKRVKLYLEEIKKSVDSTHQKG
jgi:hypothetical protein